MSNRIHKIIFTIIATSSLLYSCKKYHYHKFECLDFDSYENMVEELYYQCSMNGEDEYITFDFVLDDFEASYHLCGKNISDDLIMNGIDIPDGRMVLENISPFIVNKSSEGQLAISFSNISISNLFDTEWVIVDHYDTFKPETLNYREVETLEIDRNRFYFNKIAYSPVTYALINKASERLLWVASSKGEQGFEEYRVLIENKYAETLKNI